MRLPAGRPFYKMSGSGNDFVVFDARETPPGPLAEPAAVQAICARATGVGADGVVFLEPSATAAFRMRYLNRDGSLARMCGNAALCVTRLAVELEAAPAEGFVFDSDAGKVSARMTDGEPEVDLAPIARLAPDAVIARATGERRIGFVEVGVPHLVVLCEDAAAADVAGRGAALRAHASLADGANVNFLSRSGGEWRMRTYERGVEAETLACGTGAAAAAALLHAWGEAAGGVGLRTRSGSVLRVRLAPAGGGYAPSLRGEGRIVFGGVLGEL
ncbi:MAG TPA: diaminopimelate epimerase [Gemmatimonadaceae bacterium]|nr:diaminopimelate epimerase [Gemmatimonadaceae bacterium]